MIDGEPDEYEVELSSVKHGLKGIHIKIAFIYSDWDEAIGGKSELRNRLNAIRKAQEYIEETITNNMPDDKAYSLVKVAYHINRKENRT